MNIPNLSHGWLAGSAQVARLLSWRHRRGTLSISIGHRSLFVAEITADPQSAPKPHLAEFLFPPGCTLEDSERVGAEFAEFLAANNFSSRRAVVGVPAKWLIVRPYDMPPADDQTASSVLWLHAAERIIPALGPMTFDYLGAPSAADSSTLLLIGLQQRMMDQLLAFARSANVRLTAITPIAAAVGPVVGRNVPSALVAFLGPAGLELIDQHRGKTRSIAFVRVNGSPQPVIAELRRTVAALPPADDSLGNDSAGQLPRQLVLWDDIGTPPEFRTALRQGAGLPVVEPRRDWIEPAALAESETIKGLSALALSEKINSTPELPIDFLHPKLAPPESQRTGASAAWLPWAVAVGILIFLAAAMDLFSIQRQISGLDNQLQSMQPAVDVARPYVASMHFAESFRAPHPRYLACLAELTQSLPPDGQIWLTSFNLHTDMNGEISGSAATEQNILNFRDKLGATGKFADLMCRLDAHESHGSAPSVLFYVTFDYRAHK